MQGGVNPALSMDWYVGLLQHLRENHPTIDIDCFSPIEIQGMAAVCEMSTLEVLQRLKKAGMHGLPGGGAEMLVDDVRKNVSPKKGAPANWLRVMGEAQSLGLTTSATNVIGFGEDFAARVEHMKKIRNLQAHSLKHYGTGFTSFIAWPVQLETNTFGRRNRGQNKHVLVQVHRNTFATWPYLACSLTTLSTFKPRGPPWASPLLKWPSLPGQTTQVRP